VYRADEIGNYPSFLVSLLRTVALDAAHNQANLSDSCKVLVAFLPPHIRQEIKSWVSSNRDALVRKYEEAEGNIERAVWLFNLDLIERIVDALWSEGVLAFRIVSREWGGEI